MSRRMARARERERANGTRNRSSRPTRDRVIILLPHCKSHHCSRAENTRDYSSRLSLEIGFPARLSRHQSEFKEDPDSSKTRGLERIKTEQQLSSVNLSILIAHNRELAIEPATLSLRRNAIAMRELCRPLACLFANFFVITCNNPASASRSHLPLTRGNSNAYYIPCGAR